MKPMYEAKVILTDELAESLKNKKILIIVALYTILLYYGIKKSFYFSSLFNLMLIDMFGLQQPMPFALLFFYFASVAVLPILSLLLTHDSIAGELHKKTIRYLACRAKRGSVFAGKFLGAFVLNIGINLFVYLLAIFYVQSKTGVLFMRQGLLLWLYLSVYALYFSSLGFMASSITIKPQRALHLGAVFVIIPLLFLLRDNLRWASPYHYYKYGFHLLLGNYWHVFNSILVLIVFSAFFLAISFIIFKRRDL